MHRDRLSPAQIVNACRGASWLFALSKTEEIHALQALPSGGWLRRGARSEKTTHQSPVPRSARVFYTLVWDVLPTLEERSRKARI